MRRALALACWGLSLAAAVAGCRWAHAQPDPRLAPKQQRLVEVYVQTRRCMVSAGRAARARGHFQPEVRNLMATVCGGPMVAFLRNDMPQDEALGVVARMTRTAYYEDVLGLPEPNEKNR